MTRAQRRPRIRVENNVVLTMIASVDDAHVFQANFIRLQCVDDLFGYESLTYLNRMDFEAVFTLDELTGFCSYQTGCTECGYYVLKYMKEVVEEGIEILANDNVMRGKAVYTDEDIDGIREGCLSYGAAFVFK
ncbi:hypothetical protein Hanom_Chr17g01582161 [Helianthus anomalus]